MSDSFEQGIPGFNTIPRRRLRDQPKLKNILDVLKHVEVPTDAVSIDKAWVDIKTHVFGKGFHTGVKAAIGEQVSTAAVATFGGTYGKLFALGKEIGEVLRVFTGKKKKEFKGGATPQKGEWVVIHNGRDRLAAKVKELAAATFGDTKTKAPVKLERSISIGFCMGDGELPGGFKQIFNFSTGGPEERHTSELLVLDKKHQKTLDNSPVWSKIKKFVMGDDEQPLMSEHPVNVDPGSEVVYKGEAYKIVECDGNYARITNSLRTLNVGVETLTPGRVTHTNAHNYSNKIGGSFNTSSKAKVYKGQWVWVQPRKLTLQIYPKARWELGVVRLINEAIVDGYYAMDGIRFQTLISQVTGCPKHDQNWMDLDREFLQFKIAAVKGVDVPSYKLGRDHMLEVLGLKTVGETSVEHNNLPWAPKKKRVVVKGLEKLQNILEAGIRNEAKWPNRTKDKAEFEKTRIKAANTIQRIKKIPQDTANKLVNAGGELVAKVPSDTSGTGNGEASMVFIAVLVVAAVAFLYSS